MGLAWAVSSTRKAGDYVAAIFRSPPSSSFSALIDCMRGEWAEPWLALLALLGMVPSIDAAVALVNHS